MFRRLIVALVSPLAMHATPAHAQLFGAPDSAKSDENKNDQEEWDVSNPPLTRRSVSINVDEGTWMSLDVSPDGRNVVFDLLGDIYTLPITGGAATPIASGMAWEMQPRFSPDGSKIAFTSDRGGGDNIWIMNVDGSDKRQVTKEQFRLLNNPTWSSDGNYIAARKHFTTQRSLGVGEIWLYHISGGDGVQLVKKPSEDHQKELGEPIFSADGAYVYYSQNITPGSTFIYAQDSNTDLFNIKRYEMSTGQIETAVSGYGGAVRPTPSPDGEHIAFVRRERAKSKLYLKNLKSGVERKIFDALDQDMQETWGVHGLYPNMDWTPDSKAIVFWAGGKIRMLDIQSGRASEIPFSVNDERSIIDPPRPAIDVSPESFNTTMPRFTNVSPDGKRVVFESLGKLYVKTLPGGAPRRLTTSESGFEFFPSWSADSAQIIYVAWTDDKLGEIRLVGVEGGAGATITTEPGHYRRPRLSADGKHVVFEKGRGGYLLSPEWSEGEGVYIAQIDNGEIRRIQSNGHAPHFNDNTSRIFMTVYEGEKGELVSVDLNGKDLRKHLSGALVTEFQVSTDGGHVAFTENYNAYVMPMAPGPQEVSAGRKASALPVVRASADGATYVGWGRDTFFWTLGPTLYSAKIDDLMPKAPQGESDEEAFEPPQEGVDLSLSFETAKPNGVVALTGATFITMADDAGGIIEDGVVVIEQNRITAIGESSDVTIPEGAQQIDVDGKTVLPGFIDAHAHGPMARDDIIPQRNWSAMAHLALGVTTVHDPSNAASHIFAASEYQRAGIILAPRLYSTGEIVYGAKSPSRYAVIDNYDDALEHVRRLKKQGAHSIKNYNQPRRDQRQQVVAAALKEDIAVVAEGGSLFHMDLAMVADGNSTIEHNIPQSMLYDDVLSFYGATNVAYTPTLVVTYGGPAGDPYWRQATDVWLHPILSKHVPPRVLQANSVRREKAPEADYADQVSAATAKLLSDRGVPVSIGAHGQQQGLAAHWEMWSFARGGMSPLEALKTATITPAKALGFDQDIGSLEVGKLADLVVLSSNPLDDIRNTDDISHVMLNGRLYDVETLNEVTSERNERDAYWWE